MSPLQCRLARTALGFGVRDLAALASVSPDTVARFDRGETLKPATVERLRAVLEEAGVVFLDASDGEGEGVRLRAS